MRKILLSLTCVICLLTISTQAFCQKYGHVNLGNLMTQMPEVESGSKQLETYQIKLYEDLKVKVSDWEQRYKALESQVQSLPPKEVKEREQKLVEEQQKLLQEEQMIPQKVNQKRAEIMGPIIKRIQVAIDAIGKENGYTMIFDTSVPNTVLFVDDTTNLEGLVKEKLGL